VEERPDQVAVVVRVRRERLDMFRRICAAHLAEGAEEGAGEGADSGAGDSSGADAGWAVVRLRFAAVPAARTLLSFGGDVEVVSPAEVRADLAAVAAEVAARYA
jgi:predicted DNA-binding transcriptional regulator YafY